ncbi:protein RRP5 homolog [Pollicipes pollicipes]|uniref:protein RRP5 homolog n=1 Tax=Pollicipes pollicipes TaxID=41117 RepID=UPI001884C8A6|nr:protein RRP5 homolog [Pollicipes pollicipes]
MQGSEQYFPRGGKIKRKANDLNADKANEDKLFDDQPPKKAKKQKKAKQKKEKVCDKKGTARDEDEITHVDPLRQDDLEAGMVLLGRIREVQELQLLVSLPCHLVGAVPVTHISSVYSKLLAQQNGGSLAPPLASLFNAGQYINCAVVKTDQSGHKVRNTLSVEPSDVNGGLPASALGRGLTLQCAVRSDEEHVYDMDCGVAGARAVLPKASAGGGAPLVAGQLLWCVVDAVRAQDGVHTVTLSAEPARLNAAEPAAECALTRQTLLPGLRLPVTVQKALPGGLQVGLPGQFSGLVYKTQLDEPADCPDDYNAGAVAHARVLYTLPVVRRVYLSLRPAVPGTRLLAQVLDADAQGVRLLLDGSSQVAFAPIWHATRGDSGRWRRGETARCLLLAYDAMDEVYIASMKRQKEAPVAASSLAVGQKVSCRVLELGEHGCKVELDGGAVGFIPIHHLTNVPVRNLQAMFPDGKRLKCRVVQVEPAGRRLVLTHIARLVSGELSLASEPASLRRGQLHHWIVAKVTERGLVMTGCAGLSGFVPVQFLRGAVEDHFPGQIVQCEVHKVRPAEGPTGERRVTLSPRRDDADRTWRGRLMAVRVTGRAAGRLQLVTADGEHAEVAAAHLTDVPEHADAALARYKNGDALEVVGLHSFGKKAVVTAKPLLLEAVKSGVYPTRPEDLVPGLLLPCCVVRADEQGVLVAFPCQMLDAAYRMRAQALGEGWQADTTGLAALQDRTLVAEVASRPDPETGFVRLSARLSVRRDKAGVPYLRRCLRELAALVPARPVTPAGQLSLVTGCEIVPAAGRADLAPRQRYSARVLAAPAGGYADAGKASRRKAKVSKKPARKVRARDKHWKKRSRASPSSRPTPKKRQSATSIRYSRFTLEDDS